MSQSQHTLPEQVDLAVIGGGPAGSTLAGLVARAGHSVLVLEKQQHPRFHIGESLLPHNMKIFRRLGLADELAQLGVYKAGVDFTASDETEERNGIVFADALDLADGCEHAYQVRRSDFDRLLFESARKNGADTRCGVRVRDIDFDSQPNPVLTVEADGSAHRVHARFVVDATGRDTLLARKFGLSRRNREHGTAALYAHFRGVPAREGAAAGNISIYWFDEGWIWMIPLPDGVMSIGAVCNPEYLRSRSDDVDAFFEATLQRNPHAWQRARDGQRVSDVTATGNYSYSSSRLIGERWLMAGDAGVFVDPVFSSGVYFAMHSAELGADVVNAELSGDRAAVRAARGRFERRIRKGVRELSWFIYRFPTPAMRRLFLSPGEVFRIRQAVISVLAGDVYDNPRVYWRLRLFRLIYTLSSLRELPTAWRARRQRKRNARVVFDRAS